MVGKLRFLNGSLFGRVGYPGLAPLSSRQRDAASSSLTPALRAAVRWLLELLPNVGPRE